MSIPANHETARTDAGQDSPEALSVTALSGVGAERQAQLARLKIHTVEDLLLHRPRRYEDRRHFRAIAALTPGESAAATGRVVAQGLKRFRRGRQSVFELILEDGAGRLHCRWWNMPFMEGAFQVGQELIVYGRLRDLKPRTMDHPETEIVEPGGGPSIHQNRVVPIYPATEGLTQRWLRALVWQALERHAPTLVDPWPGIVPPPFVGRERALRELHFPGEPEEAEAARQRLALDEFIGLQLGIQRRRRNLQARTRGLPCGGDNRFMRPFLAALPFRLTEAQTRVLRELRRDLSGPHPMRRLLQGDVGSGKTVVAACASLMALESGFGVAYMAPTEVLARQQWVTFRHWFEPLGIPVSLHTSKGSVLTIDTEPAEAPSRSGSSTARPRPGIALGTHALLEAGFNPARLGLVIIDEQHKFGVTQREELVRKGRYPHLLVMTATPIPRTLGLTLYGDLDVSVIDALPAERGRVRTHIRSQASLPKVWEFVRAELAAGRQAYIVYPRLEEASLQTGLKAVLQEHAQLERALAPHAIGRLHGQQSPAEKEAVLRAFRERRLQALVATSIIEVGLDVPNATVMVIENAERFGLAQLHQLRGRIGRGAADAHCILVATVLNPETRGRLGVLAENQDGFRIAEADLRLRGPGELLGQAQSGLPALRFGDLAGDLALVELARDLAARVLDREAAKPADVPQPGTVNATGRRSAASTRDPKAP